MRTGRNSTSAKPSTRERGVAIIELALSLPLLLVLLMVLIDFGHLIQSRLILTNVSREGGSIASRQDPIDVSIATMLVESGRPLHLEGADGKVIITRIDAGQTAGAPDPTILAPIEVGGLGVNSRIDDGASSYGLTPNLYDHLVFDQVQGAPDIKEVTVVEVFYKYRPITPLPYLIPGMLLSDGGGVIVQSRAVF
jgi:hypothetical protein